VTQSVQEETERAEESQVDRGEETSLVVVVGSLDHSKDELDTATPIVQDSKSRRSLEPALQEEDILHETPVFMPSVQKNRSISLY
jgi:hypothetical protein